ncbi:MAG: GHKL domain-containing protein [Alistipes sp.]|nr:GHKL domain-containing protein [Alistipes sp.]
MKQRTIPYHKIAKCVVMIFITAVITVATIFFKAYYLLIAAVPTLVLAVKSLFDIYRDIIQRIDLVFNVLNNNDFSFRFVDNPQQSDYALVNYSLNKIKDVLDTTKLQIQEKERFVELIMECANIGIITLLPNGSVLRANSKATNLFGMTRLSHINQLRPLSSVLADTILNIRGGEHSYVHYVNETGEVSLSLSCADMLQDGKQLRVVTLGDINSELSDKEIESWTKLTRILTHEIMNSLAPVTSISNTLLASPTDTESIQSGLQTIHLTSERLMSFVDSFRQVTRIPQPQRSPIYLHELIENAKRLIEIDNVAFDVDIQPADTMVYVDRELMTQVLVNLLKNAREAIGEQEGHIWITARIDSAERIIIDVCNDCGPIPNEIAEDIFTPFFTTKQDGSGIGLAVSRQIVRLHGGTLRLTSNRHNKIAFTLALD